MKSAPDQTTIESAREQGDSITPAALKARLQAGEIIAATDYDEDSRPTFWAAIASVCDDLPCVRPTWRTIIEQHVDGIRTRQKLFRIFPRQKGVIDQTLAASITFLAVCAWLMWWPL